MNRVQSVDDKAVFVFVSDANAHRSEWLEFVSPTDRHGRDAVDFCNLLGCQQLVCCPTNIAGNRLDLMMTDVPDIVDVFAFLVTALSVVCFRLAICARVQYQKYCLSEASYQLYTLIKICGIN